MGQDDGVRSNNGVVACLREIGSNKLRLIFDDVTTNEPSHPVRWNTRMFFTFQDYDKDQMSTMKLSKEEFAMIGENLVVRLIALDRKLKVT